MRVLIAALGLYGLYRFWHSRSSRHPRGLLEDEGSRPERRGRQRDGLGEERVVYEVVEHDGGWAYKVGDVFSETYATSQEATDAAERAAAAHQSSGSDEMIQYQDRNGRWHEELETGDDRPETKVEQQGASRH